MKWLSFQNQVLFSSTLTCACLSSLALEAVDIPCSTISSIEEYSETVENINKQTGGCTAPVRFSSNPSGRVEASDTTVFTSSAVSPIVFTSTEGDNILLRSLSDAITLVGIDTSSDPTSSDITASLSSEIFLGTGNISITSSALRAATLEFTNSNNWTDLGRIDLSSGGAISFNNSDLTATINADFVLDVLGTISVPSGQAIEAAGNFTTQAGSSGAGLVKSGGGRLTLSSTSNTYNANTLISEGTLQQGAIQAIPTTTLVELQTSDATFDLNNFFAQIIGLTGSGNVELGTAILDISPEDNPSFSGEIQGPGSVVLSGSGTQTFSGVSTYSGSTTLSGSVTLALSDSGSIESSESVSLGPLTTLSIENASSGATLQNLSGSGTIQLGNQTLTLDIDENSTFSGTFTGSQGGLIKQGSSTLTLTGTSSDYEGATTISEGALRLGAEDALSTESLVTFANTSSATLALGGFDTTIAGLAGGGSDTGGVNLEGATLTLETSEGSTPSYAGSINGTSSLVKDGSGTQIFTGQTLYTGATSIERGTLTLLGSGSIATSSSVTVGSEGTLSALSESSDTTVRNLSGSGLVNIGNNTLDLFISSPTTFSGTFANAENATGGVAKQGSSTLTLTGQSPLTGPFEIEGGILALSGSGSIAESSLINITNSSSLDISSATIGAQVQNLTGESTAGVTLGLKTLTAIGSQDSTFAGVITGLGGLTLAGDNTLSLSGINTYSGQTQITKGTLGLVGTGSIGDSSSVSIGSLGEIDLSSTTSGATLQALTGSGKVTLGDQTLTVNASASSTFSGLITGLGGLTLTGSGSNTFTLDSANTYLGSTSLESQTLSLSGAGSIASSSSVSLESTAILDISGVDSGANVQTLSGSGQITLGTKTFRAVQNSLGLFSGSITGSSGSFIKEGDATLILSGTSNSYSGETGVQAGTLQLAAENVIPSGSTVNFVNTSGALLSLNDNDTAVANISGGGTLGGWIDLGSATLTVGSASSDATYSGIIYDGNSGGRLTKVGSGALNLAGANTYSGLTTLERGSLVAAAANTFSPNSSFILVNILNGTLNLNDFDNEIANLDGGGSLGGFVNLGSATLTTGSANQPALYSGKIFGEGNLIKTGSALFDLTSEQTYTGTTEVQNGTLFLSTDGSIASSTFISIGEQGVLTFASISEDSAELQNLSGAGSLAMGTKNVNFTQSQDTGFSGVISGSGDVSVAGSGSLGLSGINTYTGSTTLNGLSGLTLSGIGDISSSSSVTLSSAATLSTAYTAGTTVNNLSGGGTVLLGQGILTLNQTSALTYSGKISEGTGIAGNIKKAGSSTLTLSGSSSDYSGVTFITDGSIEAGSAGAFSPNSIVNLDDTLGVGLNLAGFDNSVGGLTGGGSAGGSVSLGGATLTINASEDVSYAGSISGGTLIKTGSSKQTLTNINSYSGQTSIVNGTLALSGLGSIFNSAELNISDPGIFSLEEVTSSAVIGRLSGSGQITIGSKLLTINQSGGDTTYGGTFVGTGNVIKAGSDTLTLSAPTSHTGAMAITAGTLTIESSDTLASCGSVAITGGTLNAMSAGANITNLLGTGGFLEIGSNTLNLEATDLNPNFSGRITGLGGNMTLRAGTNTMGLGGVNTFTGQTQLESGTLAMTLAGSLASSLILSQGTTFTIGETTLGSSVGTLSGEGNIELGDKILSISQSSDSVFSGSISGSGSLVKRGTSDLRLDGSSTFDGGVTLAAGELSIGSDRALGTGSITIEPLTTLEIENTVSASNRVILSGESTFKVDGGSASLLGQISGSGTLNKTGEGLLTLEGEGLFTGTTNILAGALTINNTFASDINTDANTILGGNLDTSGNITVAGVLKPGNSPGDISGGNITLEPGSSLIITIETSDFSTIAADDTLSIDSSTTVDFTIEPGYNQFNQNLTFATANEVVGTFAEARTSTELLSANLSYNPSSVAVSFSLVDISNSLSSGNAASTWSALEESFSSGNEAIVPIVATLYPLSLDQINNALNQMQPSNLKGLTISQENNAIKVRETLSLRLDDRLNTKNCTPHKSTQKGNEKKTTCDEPRKDFHVWTDGFGDTLHQGSIYAAGSPQSGYQIDSWGITAGIDYNFADYFYVGALGGYTSTDAAWSNNAGSGDIYTGYAGLYVAALTDIFYASAAALGGWSSYDTSRNIIYPGVNETATGSHGGSQLLLNLTVGLNIGLNYGGFTIRPFDSLDAITQTESSFTETGAGAFNLFIDEVNAIMFRNELGLQADACLCFKHSKWTLSPKFSWVRQIRTKGSNTMAEFSGSTDLFKVTGYFPSRNLYAPGVSVTSYWCNDALALELYYSGEYGQKYSDSTYGGQLRFGF